MIIDTKSYKIAKENLLTGNLKAGQQFFEQNGCILETAYCYLLDDNLKEAKKLFELILEKDIRAHWGLFLISLIEGIVVEYPSYFEIRNFLEIDLNILILYCKGDYVEKIIRYADYMFTINPEVYKFIGRVFDINDLKEQAMFFLNKAKGYFYHDPELHFLLADIYYRNNDLQNAKKSLENCLYVLPGYFPAINLARKIANN